MNWTGGRLSRHSGTSNPVKDRQKQHFAKVQQALHSGPRKHSPIKWSFFGPSGEDRGRSQRKSSAAQQRSSQANGRGESQSSRQHHVHLSSDISLAQQHDARRSSRSQLPFRSRQILVPVKKELSRVPGNDLYNATPSPLEMKQEREDPIPGLEMENLVDQKTEAVSFSEKRRKILRKGDWVGVSMQRPLHIVFASPRKEEKIGRRRKLTDGHRARYSSKQIHITSPFPTKSRLLANQGPSQEWSHRGEPGRTDVRISIGGRVVPPGVSSSSAPRKIGSHSTIAPLRSQTTSSDVMLLDAETSIAQESPRMATSKYLVLVPQTASYSQNFRPINTRLAEAVTQGDHTSYEAEDIGNGWAGVFSEAASEQHDNVHKQSSHQDFFEVYPKNQNPRISPAKDYNNNIHHGRLIFSSSSASIHHPAPRSSKVSVLLRSASSEVAESTLAQVGNVEPIIPSSQVLDNEIWETWVVPEENYDQSSNNDCFDENRNVRRVSISPGISIRPEIWQADTITGESEDGNLCQLRGPYSKEPKLGSEEMNAAASALSNEIAMGSSGLAQEETKEVEKKSLRIRQCISPAEKRLAKATVSNIFPDQDIIEKDQNESWTKFLFGGFSDEVVPPVPTPKFNVVPTQRGEFFGTSIPGQSSGDGSTRSYVNAALQHTNTPAAHSTISGGTSRTTEASPCPTGSRHREPNMEVAPTVDSPLWKSGVSVGAERGSIFASNLDSVSVSVAVQAKSQQSPSDIMETASLYRPQRKVMFTKPNPFIGRKANLDSVGHGEPLRIGRNLGEGDERNRPKRKRERDVYCLLGAEGKDDREEVDSIEGD